MVVFCLLFFVSSLFTQEAELHVSPIIKPSGPFYPGEKVVLGYEIRFKGAIALTKEELPLLQGGEGLEKIGDPIGKKEEIKNFSQQVLTQHFKITQAGSIPFKEALLEGVAYKEDPHGNKIPLQKVIAKTKPQIITVLPFPEDKPKSFTGALGSYTSSITPPQSDTLQVGEPFILKATIQGDGDTVSFPDLLCRKGWGGFFSLEVPPKLVEKKEDVKKYDLVLIPLTDEIQQIPPITFSFFDPQKGRYEQLKSPPFPVTVKEQKTPPLIKEKETPFHLPASSLIVTTLIAITPLFLRHPLALIALLPLLVNSLILLFQNLA